MLRAGSGRTWRQIASTAWESHLAVAANACSMSRSDLLPARGAIDFVYLCSRVPVENEVSFAMVLGEAPFDHVHRVVRSAPALQSRARHHQAHQGKSILAQAGHVL